MGIGLQGSLVVNIVSDPICPVQAHRHIGIYAYRVGFLKKYAQLAVTELEKIESLEQLRVLYHGYKIGVVITKNAPASGVDTQEDLDFVRGVFKVE